MAKVNPIPEGFHTVTPHIVLKDAAEAIEFYKKAFGAEEIDRMSGPDGKTVMHAELQIGDSRLMVCDEFPGMTGYQAPSSLKGTTVTLHLYVPDVDAVFARAVEAGAEATMKPMDAFWGDRYGKLVDPFGHHWGVATRVKNLTPEEIAKGAQEFCSGHKECGS